MLYNNNLPFHVILLSNTTFILWMFLPFFILLSTYYTCEDFMYRLFLKNYQCVPHCIWIDLFVCIIKFLNMFTARTLDAACAHKLSSPPCLPSQILKPVPLCVLACHTSHQVLYILLLALTNLHAIPCNKTPWFSATCSWPPVRECLLSSANGTNTVTLVMTKYSR